MDMTYNRRFSIISPSAHVITTMGRCAITDAASPDRSLAAIQITSMELLDPYTLSRSTTIYIYPPFQAHILEVCHPRCPSLPRFEVRPCSLSHCYLPHCEMHLLRPHHGNKKALSMLLLASLRADSMLLLSPTSPDPLHRHHHTPPAEIL